MSVSDYAAIWARDYTDESGAGSREGFVEPYQRFLEGFIEEHKPSSILDLACGDYVTMRGVKRSIPYYGLDIIDARVTQNAARYEDELTHFLCVDIRELPLTPWPSRLPEPWALIVCKDVLQHWPNADVHELLRKLLRQAGSEAHVLLTNCVHPRSGETVNQDIEPGGWRPLDLTKPPFSVGEVVFRWGTKEVVRL